MAAKIISQRKWAKLVAATGALSQPPGALTRLSNLFFTQRGSLQIADGSVKIATIPPPYTLIEALAPFSNLVPGQFPYYSALALNPAARLADVTGLQVTGIVAGSGNPPAYYSFGIVATLAGGHSDISPTFIQFHSVVNFSSISFSWNAVPGATGYQIYVVNAIPPFNTGSLIATVGAVTSTTISGAFPGSPIQMPFGNTSYLLQLFNGAVASGVLTFTAVTAGIFPASIPSPVSLAPGGPQFNPTTTLPGFSPYGGVSGIACPIPEVIQFAGKAILILGNGYAPQAYDPSLGSSAAVTPLVNTFTAAYPTWQASVDWITGAQLSALYGSTNYLFTATQGGVSGSGSTPFTGSPPASGTPVSDGSVIWTSQGPIAASIAPIGAAHAVAYAGSLWLANTSPVTTDIDGPSCLKMSDSNNPNSWNPVNTAFIGRQDGTQITGLCSFTIAALGISPTGSLCVFKEFTTYQVIGVFGSTSFDIQPAQTNLGCLAARSIQFLPGFGVVRFTHLGFAVFDGINDRLIDEDIRPYLFGGVDSEADLTPVDSSFLYRSVSAQTTNPPMYLCAMPLTGQSGAMTRLFCFDLVMKSWTVLDLPWAIDSMSAMAVGEGYPLVLAGKADGTIQRLQAGDLNWDQGDEGQAAVQWSFRSPDVFGEGSSQRIFYETATIRGYGNPAMVSSIVARLWLDGQMLGTMQGIDIVPQGGSNLFEARVTLFRSGYRAHLDISGNNGGAGGVIDAIDWAVVPKSSLARRIIG